jgi:hypothetical protein
MVDGKSEKTKELEKLVSNNGDVRHFTFEPSLDWNDLFDNYHPELGLAEKSWQVMLGNLGVLFCHSYKYQVKTLLINQPNFTELYREFDTLKTNLAENEVALTEPVLCWLRGLIHAFMTENPNPVTCSVVMTGTSSNQR